MAIRAFAIAAFVVWGASLCPSAMAQQQPPGNGDPLEAERRAAELAVENAGNDGDLATALFELARVQSGQGRLMAALDSYERSVDIRRRLVEADPDSGGKKLDLVVSLTGLGDVQRGLGDFAGALSNYEEQLALVRHLVATVDAPEIQVGLQSMLATVFQQLGDAQTGLEEFADARASYRQAVDLSQGAVAAEPSSAEYRYQLATSLLQLSDAQYMEDDSAGNRASLQQALDIFRRLVAQEFRPAEVHRDFVNNLYKLGVVTNEKAYYQEALEVILAMQERGILLPEDVWKVDDLRGLSAGFTKEICPALTAAIKYSDTYFADITGDVMYRPDTAFAVAVRKTSLVPSWADDCSVMREGSVSNWGCDVRYETAADGSAFFDSPNKNAFEELKSKVRACLDASWQLSSESPADSLVPTVVFRKGDRSITVLGLVGSGHIEVARTVETE